MAQIIARIAITQNEALQLSRIVAKDDPDSLLHKTLHEIAYRRPYKLGSHNYVYLDINLLVNLMDRVDGTLHLVLEKAYNQSMGIKEEELV